MYMATKVPSKSNLETLLPRVSEHVMHPDIRVLPTDATTFPKWILFSTVVYGFAIGSASDLLEYAMKYDDINMLTSVWKTIMLLVKSGVASDNNSIPTNVAQTLCLHLQELYELTNVSVKFYLFQLNTLARENPSLINQSACQEVVLGTLAYVCALLNRSGLLNDVDPLFTGVACILNCFVNSPQLQESERSSFFMTIVSADHTSSVFSKLDIDGLQLPNEQATGLAILRLLAILLETVETTDLTKNSTMLRQLVLHVFEALEIFPRTLLEPESENEKSVYLALMTSLVTLGASVDAIIWPVFESAMFEGILCATNLSSQVFAVDCFSLLLDQVSVPVVEHLLIVSLTLAEHTIENQSLTACFKSLISRIEIHLYQKSETDETAAKLINTLVSHLRVDKFAGSLTNKRFAALLQRALLFNCGREAIGADIALSLWTYFCTMLDQDLSEDDVLICFQTFLLPLQILCQQLSDASTFTAPIDGIVEPLAFLLAGTQNAMDVAGHKSEKRNQNIVQTYRVASALVHLARLLWQFLGEEQANRFCTALQSWIDSNDRRVLPEYEALKILNPQELTPNILKPSELSFWKAHLKEMQESSATSSAMDTFTQSLLFIEAHIKANPNSMNEDNRERIRQLWTSIATGAS
ncbi:hypothetical protein HDV05_003554 [Chytridiales sp. JEL 0842]|nr:hypothetical protein HDV05_003554 [Chytridiales sp. JEL 0842]